MEQNFRTDELKAALEDALGFRLASLKRLDGGCALNFKAVREGDGFAFAVKCSPPGRRDYFGRLVRHLDDLKGTKAVQRIFEKECPPEFRGNSVVCMAWCGGKRRMPDSLSPRELRDFAADFAAFSSAMQKTSKTMARLPYGDMRRTVVDNCRGAGGRILRRLVDEIVPGGAVEHDPDRVRIIHGDFHHGNFLFEGGRVAGFFDLEEFRKGYPAEDAVRWIACAAEHLHWWNFRRRKRTLDAFAAVVRLLRFPEDEWRLAVGGAFLQKAYKTARNSPPGAFAALNLAFRARFYRRMLQICRAR